ncbi:Oidioi.mRNA.OKI2018_I69.XSR.g14163.t1.cds [Oikopleura dioica]|uniref:Oidioi.mRNA.OKI2018_I69.XSR.g14163.t1.cds n=1 Tax=Oikopleura dioica TaxID=34765 RepID=A0ABN7SCW4_OIKDI|nr:Oidioi.mRNA.OKI2018_I69.XSR.g14163.t1.cds [Oikopleura dioica]
MENVIMSASEYVDNLMTWVSELIDDESVFPSLLNKPFPQNFKATCSDIIRRLFRVYAHIYIDHIQHIRNPRLDEEAHLNTSFRHFILFAQEFQLIPLNELAPLQKIIDRLTKH